MEISRQLSGKIVRLRAVELGDAEQCVAWLANPDVTRYMTTDAQTLESERLWIGLVRGSLMDLVTAILVRGENGVWRHVGNCGLHRIDRTNGTAEIGIFIGDETVHGRGIGSDAMRTLIMYALRELGLNKVWASVYGPNVASRKMCIKAGLIEEGILREQIVHPEGRIDIHRFGALAQEWCI